MKRRHALPIRGKEFAGLLLVVALCLPVVSSFASDNVTLSLFPPQVFYRDPAKPASVVCAFNVPSSRGTFVLHVRNGAGTTDNLVSSAVITVNGMPIVASKDFNQQVDFVDRPLTNLVKGRNTVEIQVRSVPSSYIAVSIQGTYYLGISISDPVQQASLLNDTATVQGTWRGYTADAGIVVNGVPAVVTGNSFIASDVPLVPGGNALSAVVTTFDGISNSDNVSVVATGEPPPVALWANFTSGVPPLAVAFKPQIQGILPVEYRYDFNGDGVADNTVATDDGVAFSYQAPGTYRATVTAADDTGQSYVAEKVIVVQDRPAMDALLSGRWAGMSASLQSSDIDGSLAGIAFDRRDKYRKIFTPLLPQFPAIFASASAPEFIKVEGNIAQYRVKRNQIWDGVRQTVTYYVWFVKDSDGVWRVDRF